MSKRSPRKFERRERDFYPTPLAAVSPLIPHLRGVRTFAEPCCGDGKLVRHLESFGLRCVYAGDIASGLDALALTVADCNGADAIITNTPYSRELMHRLIEHFRRITRMTWLLLPADWMHNRQAAPFLPSCTDVVSVGRVRWFEGTKMSSMENFAWYRFDAHHSAGPILHARDSASLSSRVGLCAHCGKPYRPRRSDARFCGDTCRQRAHRNRLVVTSRDVRG
ncbi:hypothetical protein [Bradyrhizobium sp. CCBAU 45389]|uniref:hypothetical protein n=1 Tax=Bradyrhizobium sp. CCBAU 45389 TaxID=858429 RepID=UPI002305329F|nr:hypothetical protein [Bradyrhizobium sp. CCBAU 45389]